MKKYAANWAGTTFIFVIGLGIWILGSYLQMQESTFSGGGFPGIELIAAASIIAVILFVMIFSYAVIEGNTLKFVWLFFLRRTIDIDSITHINDQNTFKIAKSQFRSLYIFYKDKAGDTKSIEFRITIFPERTLGLLVKDLKAINPRIELNAYAEKLSQSAR
jgi:hypothetical protein